MFRRNFKLHFSAHTSFSKTTTTQMAGWAGSTLTASNTCMSTRVVKDIELDAIGGLLNPPNRRLHLYRDAHVVLHGMLFPHVQVLETEICKNGE